MRVDEVAVPGLAAPAAVTVDRRGIRTEPVGFERTKRSRMARIAQVAGGDGTNGLSGSCTLQTDVPSIPARRLVARLDELGAVSSAKRLLAGWNFRYSRARIDAEAERRLLLRPGPGRFDNPDDPAP